MSEILEQYRRFLGTLRGASAKTVDTYTSEVKSLLLFLSSRNVTFNSATYDDFLAWRESMTRKPRGIALALASARSFYNFLDDRCLVRPNPFPRGLTVKIKRQEPIDVPTGEQFVNHIRPRLDAMRCSRIDAMTRRAIVETLAGTGLRIDAAMTMTRDHLHLDGPRPYILVDAQTMACKGHMAGQVPMAPYAAKVLNEYLHANVWDGPIFRIKPHNIRTLLHNIAPDGINLKPHSLRHFYCSMTYYRNFDGGRNDIIWVRDAAGHGSVATTDGYLKLARRIVQDNTIWERWALAG